MACCGPQALEALRGCDHLVHGGDVGDDDILDALDAIAPLTAVRGNNDRSGRAGRLPHVELVELEGVGLYVVHDLADLDIDPIAAGVGVVVSGHSHRPRIETRDGVLYVNPGSAGPRRFRLPITLAEIHIVEGRIGAHIVELDISSSAGKTWRG